MRLRVSGAVVLAALVVVAAGCGGDPEPILAPTLSASSTSTSATPSPSESEVVEQTPEEFIARFFAANDEMRDTGETKPFLSLSRNCASCDGLAQEVEQIYQAGGAIDGDPWIVSEVVPRGGSNDYTVLVSIPPSRSRTSADGEWVKATGGDVEFHLRLVGSDGARRVGNLTVMAK